MTELEIQLINRVNNSDNYILVVDDEEKLAVRNLNQRKILSYVISRIGARMQTIAYKVSSHSR